jgi:hypothetical protein
MAMGIDTAKNDFAGCVAVRFKPKRSGSSTTLFFSLPGDRCKWSDVVGCRC